MLPFGNSQKKRENSLIVQQVLTIRIEVDREVMHFFLLLQTDKGRLYYVLSF